MSRKPNPIPVEGHIDPKTLKEREDLGIARVLGTKKKEDGDED